VNLFRWNVDPAAYGPRWRKFWGPWELIAYFTGEWEVRHRGVVRMRGPSGGRLGALRGLVGAWIGGGA